MDTADNRELFARHGLKNTRHRNLIYDLLRPSELPLTAEDVFLRLKDVDASVSLSTVYRILDAFAEKGLAVKADSIGGGKAAYEICRAEHRHRLVCMGCKKTVPIDGCPLEKFEKTLSEKTQFDITSHRLEIFGYCPECKEK